MIKVYTGSNELLNQIDGYENNRNRIAVCEDVHGFRYIPIDVVISPDFSDLQPLFEQLTEIDYTPPNEDELT